MLIVSYVFSFVTKNTSIYFTYLRQKLIWEFFHFVTAMTVFVERFRRFYIQMIHFLIEFNSVENCLFVLKEMYCIIIITMKESISKTTINT